MGPKAGCGGIGCLLAFMAALLGLGYYAYTTRPLDTLYQPETTEQTIQHARQIQERHRHGDFTVNP